MKTIFIKELRENLKWAGLIALALGVAMFLALSGNQNFPGIIGILFQNVTIFGFAAAGFILGLLQVLQDKQRDRWAFIAHRPVSRTTIFFGKVMLGVVLYVLATGVPFAAAIIWVATPGHLPSPFSSNMIKPGLADLISGLMWYSTGLLVGARQARWIGSRLMPIGLAFVGSLLAYAMAIDLTEAGLVSLAGVLILLPAAWGSFVYGGVFEPQPRIVRLLQSLAIVAGLGLVVAMGAGILSETLRILLGPNLNSSSIALYQYEYYAIDKTGKALRVTATGGRTTKISDLQGNELPAMSARDLSDRTMRMSYFWLASKQDHNLPWAIRHYRASFRRAESYGVGFTMNDDGAANWFYVAQRRTIEGYDPRTALLIGSVGPDGFADATQSPCPFDEPLQITPTFPGMFGKTTVWCCFGGSIRTIERIFQSTPDDPIVAVNFIVPSDTASFRGMDGEARQRAILTRSFVVVTRSSVNLLKDGKVFARVPVNHPFPPYQALNIGQASDGRYILLYNSALGIGDWGNNGWVDEVDANGKIISQTELPRLRMASGPARPVWLKAVDILPAPPGLVSIIAPIESAIYGQKFWTADAVETAMLILVGLVSTGACWRIARRRAFDRSGQIVWACMGLLGGLTGVLLLLCLRQRPARLPCLSCGRMRVVTRETCEHCAAKWASPMPDGTEIFESVDDSLKEADANAIKSIASS